jgi:formylglycine-generating enzyme required for sulfatase activity
MKKLLITVAILASAVVVAGCGDFLSMESAGGDLEETSGEAEATQAAVEEVAAEATPTPVKLATPTPKSAPPTPTPIPPTPTPQEGQEASQEEEPQGPSVTDIMVEIPAGPFIMGSDEGDPEDAPAHEVDLPAFEIDKFEVTNADFATFVEETGYVTYYEEKGYPSWRDEWGEGEDNHPVVMVTWNDAVAYCEWVGKRLPTEAEWEKAARGEDGRSFPWGEGWDPEKANVKETGLRGTVVGGFGAGASPYGVEDMIGNVSEWTADWYQAYPGNMADDAAYGETCRVTRGGSWFDVEPQGTSFTRNCANPDTTANDELGFRCAR